jgi:predicted RNA-binding protein associated with RNAse of E/G family
MNKETLSEINERLDALEYELATIRSAEVAVRQIAHDIRALLGPEDKE